MGRSTGEFAAATSADVATDASATHNADVTIRRLDGLNHLFQTARTGAIGEDADIEETISPVPLSIVTEWIEARFKRNGVSVRMNLDAKDWLANRSSLRDRTGPHSRLALRWHPSPALTSEGWWAARGSNPGHPD